MSSNSKEKNQIFQEPKPWKNWVNYDYKEFENKTLKVIDGQIPEDLQGTLFRNTSACLNRNGQTLNHIFDGDGAILKVEFKDKQAIGSWKYIQTESFKQEQKANQFIFQGLHSHAKGCCKRYFSMPDPKNTGNTSVLPLYNDKMLCLWEGGPPYSVKKSDLSTIGIDNLNGNLKKKYNALSAHYRVDWQSKQIYHYGLDNDMGNYSLNLKICDFYGNVNKCKSHKIRSQAFVHDMVIAGDYMVFVLPSFCLSTFDLICRKKTIWGSANYPQKDCEIQIYNKNTLEHVKTCYTPKFMVWHFTNGYVNENNQIVIQLPLQRTEMVNNLFTDILKGNLQPGTIGSSLKTLIIDLNTGNVKVEDTQMNYPGDFPTYDENLMGQKWDTTFMNINDNRDTADYMNNIIKYDCDTGKQTLYKLNSQTRYLQEPVPTPDNKYISALGIHGGGKSGKDVSEIHIINAESMEKECILELPDIVPISFHGKWDQIN